jgi:hypothetical protein
LLTRVIPATWEAEIGRTAVGGQPRQKVSETQSQPIIWVWWHWPDLSATQEALGRPVSKTGDQEQNWRPYLKNN